MQRKNLRSDNMNIENIDRSVMITDREFDKLFTLLDKETK
jgi:hypothetical protein